MKPLLTCFFFFWIFVLCASAQHRDSLYQRADRYNERFASKFYYSATYIQAVDSPHCFVYTTQTPKGKEFYLIDAERKTQKNAFDQERLAVSLSNILDKKIEAYNLPFQQVRFSGQMDSVYFRIETNDYCAVLKDYTVAELPDRNRGRESYWGNVFKEDAKENVPSPDGKWEAYISEGNLWIKDRESGNIRKLSDDGSPYEYYSSNIYWSPDSRKIVCCKYRPGGDRKLLLISSSPQDRLQPETAEYDYPKPGDALPVRRPVVFLPDEDKVIRFDLPDADSQFDLNYIRWNKNSDFFTFEFNKRGHQQYIVYTGDVHSGTLRQAVKEESATFVYYQALYRYWFKESDELLWISERDGWRHIYLYDVLAGKVKQQLTKGEWVVKTVVRVDEKNRRILFKACGMDRNEDPYLEKYYTLDMNNGKITPLTPENAHHNVTFSPDYRYMLDLYSRVDLPPALVIRSVEDGGKIVYTPNRQPDISEVTASGWRMPEVFSAKGRDGKTDIWGMIIRPSDFDPAKKYPVIEYIYAGPHDSHVPKSFSIAHRPSALAELGFITVMIDGMGTANRSKAFHDVCWKNLKDAGFSDRIAWLKSAAEIHLEMDIERVGIYGGSAGGQNAMAALLFHPDFYKAGVAACGCHDNRMDKIWWNEQWMGYPVGKQYEECSNVVNAHLLKGHLMLILGELDNNVDPSSTLQVVNELIKHDKEFEFVMLPGAGHTLGEKYGERKRRDFFMKHLLMKLEMPEWNIK
jgi:dipeptidyl aminopeptidase/acylaminoacyl peptidase